MPEATGADRRRQSQELNIFHDVAKALTSSLDLDSILQTIMEKMAEYFRPDTWSLLMVDEEHNELYFAIAVGDAADALKDVRLKVGEGIAGWVAKHGERVVVPDVYTDPRFAKRIDEMTQWETRSIICVPLRSKLRVLGVIQLVNVRMENFTDQESFFLQSICDYAAIAIENARLLNELRQRTDHLSETRRIHTDGHTWPTKVTPSIWGYSIGRWTDQDGDGRYGELHSDPGEVQGPERARAARPPRLRRPRLSAARR